jgi:hypothetical protein
MAVFAILQVKRSAELVMTTLPQVSRWTTQRKIWTSDLYAASPCMHE